MHPTPDLPRIHDYVAHWAQVHPDREALVLDPLRWTYRDLADQVDELACTLLASGIGPGDRVAVMGTPRPECFTVMLAASSIGAITGCRSAKRRWRSSRSTAPEEWSGDVAGPASRGRHPLAAHRHTTRSAVP
jgi:hypothetical protein